MKLTLYGTQSNRFAYTKYFLENFIKQYQYALEIYEESSIQAILDKNLSAIPVLEFEDGEIIALKSDMDIDEFNILCAIRIIEKINNPNIHRILVPIDFSPQSINAYKFARDFAKNKNVRIDLLHVYENGSNQDVARMKQTFIDKFQAIVSLNSKIQSAFEWIPTFPRVEFGEFDDRLFTISYEYDLIILGLSLKNLADNHRKEALDLGYVVKSKCPLLLVPENYQYHHMAENHMATSPKETPHNMVAKQSHLISVPRLYYPNQKNTISHNFLQYLTN